MEDNNIRVDGHHQVGSETLGEMDVTKQCEFDWTSQQAIDHKVDFFKEKRGSLFRFGIENIIVENGLGLCRIFIDIGQFFETIVQHQYDQCHTGSQNHEFHTLDFFESVYLVDNLAAQVDDCPGEQTDVDGQEAGTGKDGVGFLGRSLDALVPGDYKS